MAPTMKRSNPQSEASLSDSDVGGGGGSRGGKRHCRQQQQQQQANEEQAPASPENPHKLVEVGLPRRQEELLRCPPASDLLLLGNGGSERPAGDASSLAIIIPRCASWFSYRSVHRIEKLAFPQLFAASPQLYISYRNYMIDSYRASPRRHFPLASCSRDLPGDIRVLASLHAFLEHWGLINLQADVDAGTEEAAVDIGVPFYLLKFADDSGDVLEPLDAPGIDGLLPREQPDGDSAAEQQQQQQQQQAGSGSVGLRVDQYCPMGPELRGPGARRNDWSDAELLALLEGVELYGDDWSRIAERVGAQRTQEECILQMLKLPIVDPYLEGSEHVLGPLAEELVPFGQAANPVMCTVAFLASAVDPRVASAAALSALGEYSAFGDAKGDDAERVAAELRGAAGRIAASVLSAAAEKSAELSRVELCKMRALALQLAEAQMKKIEAKLRHYQELDAFVDKERECLDAQLHQAHLERQGFHQELVRAAEAAAAADSL